MDETAYYKTEDSINQRGLTSAQPIPQSVGMQLLNHMETLIERERQIYSRLEDLLQPVLLPSNPCPTNGIGKDVEEYPPLFTEMRNKFQIMSSTMDGINALLDRVRV